MPTNDWSVKKSAIAVTHALNAALCRAACFPETLNVIMRRYRWIPIIFVHSLNGNQNHKNEFIKGWAISEKWFTKMIQKCVELHPGTSSDDGKALKSLTEKEVVVSKVEGTPGNLHVKIFPLFNFSMERIDRVPEPGIQPAVGVTAGCLA
ncbi:MAG: hypothetical protein ABW101_01580 [Candidatus Thiodiazotropha sp.]